MIAIPRPPVSSARVGLRLLRPDLNRAILIEALVTRSMSVSELCGQLMLESDTTLREGLDQLERVGAVARDRTGPQSGGAFGLTPAGTDLIALIALTGAWLKARPENPLSPDREAAWRAFAALADGWEVTLLQHLLLCPSTKAELLKTIPLSREKLKRMLRRLRGAGLLELVDREAPSPRYALTVWARQAIAILVAIAYWERLHLPSTAEPVAASDGAIALLASLPLIQPPIDASGICAITVEGEPDAPAPRSSAVWIRLDDGRVTDCQSGTLPGPPDAWIHGGVRAWLRAVIKGKSNALHLGGDALLAELTLRALREERFEISRPDF